MGYVNKEMILKTMPEVSNDTLIGFCGPNAMKDLVGVLLRQIGYPSENFFSF